MYEKKQLLKNSFTSNYRKAGLFYQKGCYTCQRCQTNFKENLFLLKDKKTAYCPFCQNMGQLTTNSYLYYQKEAEFLERKVTLALTYPLSSFQQQASAWLLKKYQEKTPHFLLWAVTGAGKTEMTYPLIKKVLEKGKIVAWTSPRVDVCLEIHPRLQQNFPDEKISLLYGNSPASYEGEAFVVATTHQLLRFVGTFDLLIIDEVDAFPYVNNSFLKRASQRALNKQGCLLSLTATPTKEQGKEMKRQKLPFYLLPARFHQNPLVVPEFWYQKKYKESLLKHFPLKLKELLSEKRWLIFCPEIKWMLIFEETLKKFFPTRRVVSIYANDPKREEKVRELREEKYDLVCTTTILERGVTLKDIQVIVLGSHERIYKKEVLVQISGRVGRHPDFATGQVIFLHEGITRNMKQSKREIEKLNLQAKKEGYLGDLL